MCLKRILIVDEDKDNQTLLKEILTSCEEGFHCSAVNNFTQAQEITEMFNFDCIFIDVNSPDTKGIEFFSHIQKRTNQRKTPIIALTSESLIPEQEKNKIIGFSEHLSKPFSVSKVSNLLEKYRSILLG